MANTHKISVGHITCTVLHEGGSAVTIDGIKGRYPGVSEQDIIDALGGKTESESSLNCLYIDSNGTKILADVGFGEAQRPPMGNVEPALESIGVSAGDIDIVYITHFHGDHIAGLLRPDGTLTYPNARYITAQDEWDEWIPRWETSNDERQQQQLAMMKSLESKFSFVDEGDEIAPGVSVVMIPGHTLGQSGLLVQSNGDNLIHLADVLHNSIQFAHTDWHFAFDSDGDLGAKTRVSILNRCADENLRTLFYHLPFPGIGHVTKTGNIFEWKPI